MINQRSLAAMINNVRRRRARDTGAGVRTPPAGLGWPTSRNGKAVPQAFRKVGNRWEMVGVARPIDLVTPGLDVATQVYRDFVSGNDGNDGLSVGQAVRTAPRAFSVGNALGTPYRFVDIVAGRCYFQQGFNNNSLASTEPTQPVAIMPSAGRVISFAGSSETFPATTNATYTNSFVGGPASATRVFNILTNTEMSQLADAAAVDASVGVDAWVVSSATGSAKTHIRRADGLQPTPTNTLVVRNVISAAFDAFTSDFYIENFDFQGGSLGGLLIDGKSGNKNVVINNVTANYAGTSVNMSDGISLVDINGLAALFDVVCDNFNWKDAINGQQNASAVMHMLVMNCIGANAGKSPSTSNNGFTTHDDVIAAVIGGQYYNSFDGSVAHCIENSKTWYLGATITATASGGVGTAAVKAGNNNISWVEDCVVTAPVGQYALDAEVGATIYYRNSQINGAIRGNCIPF